MQFNSYSFMAFFPVVLAIYFIIPKKARKLWLLAASYYFYMSWNARYIILIVGSTLITYFSALAFSKLEGREGAAGKKRLVMILCCVSNLFILALFKYGNFVIDSINGVLSGIGLSVIDHRFDFLLPVGISFYTFQALGYMIDVYRGDIKAEKNFINYALFVSFFPQLVAGPIERSKNLLGQIEDIVNKNLWEARRVASGAILMIWGLFMKMVIADRVAILVDQVFDNYRMYGGIELVAAAIGFALQIYCDFGSYSMIAIGSARILGINLMENFKAPYLSVSIRDFWSRWHISLSTWFRDYLYIPLGGNRKGKARKYLNLLIVFLVSGLWHGAEWSFVAWGGIHGIYQILEDVLFPFKKRVVERFGINTECFSHRLIKRLWTFVLVTFAWIFFRANTIKDALRFIYRIGLRWDPWNLFNESLYQLGLDRTEMNILIVSVVILLLVDILRQRKGQMPDTFLFRQNIWFEWAVIIGMILMILTYGKYGPDFDPKQFIYFQF